MSKWAEWIVLPIAVLGNGCAFPTRGILHSNTREPIQINNDGPSIEMLLGPNAKTGDSKPTATHGYLDEKACSTNILGWATGDASNHAAYKALRDRIDKEVKVQPNHHTFIANLRMNQSYRNWLGVWSETCTFVGGDVLEGLDR